MSLSSKTREIQQFLSDDFDWLEHGPSGNSEELLVYAKLSNETKERLHDLSPFVYSSVSFSSEHPELYDTFVRLHDKVNHNTSLLEEQVSKQLDFMETCDRHDLVTLRQIMQSCRHSGDEANFHRAQRLHNEEAMLKHDATSDVDGEYLGLRREFVTNKWKTKDISDLEKMLERSDLLVEKGRFLDDSELVYHGSELSNEIVSVVNDLKSKRNRTRKAKIGLAFGVALTAFTLIQHYTPVEPVQNFAKNSYNWVKQKLE